MTTLEEPLRLRSGALIPNRIAKAATEELLAAPGQLPGDRLMTLYRRWGAGGAGLLITGHVVVDRRFVAQPGDVVLEDGTPLEPFRRWADGGRSGGGQVWMQLNHPGRVVQRDLTPTTWAPSATPIAAGAFSRLYPTPHPMTPAEIDETVERFALTAGLARSAGFDGIQVHAAHGYLLSQFLSPLVNRREDRWGGSLPNRARLLLDVVGAVRERVGPHFALAVKLNSADFQRGGFDVNDAGQVIGMLADAGVDLVELSGGSIESLATAGAPADGRTLPREAYFLDLARQLVATSPLPLMLTGGIRRRAAAERVLGAGVAMVGVATALATDPGLPRAWLAGTEAPVRPLRAFVPGEALAAAAVQAATSQQLARLSAGGRPGRRLPPSAALVAERLTRVRQRRAYLAWRDASAPVAPRVQRTIVQRRYGDPAAVLELSRTHPVVAPAATQVQIRVHAAALNPIDWQMIEGDRRLIARRAFPFVPLFDLAGVVEAVGAQVTRFRVGDAVHADNERHGGGAGELVNVEEDLVCAKPDQLSFAQAAALPLAAQTALLTMETGGVGPGSRVCVVGASGGVGTFAVQIARALGAAHVVGVCSDRNRDLVLSLGADATIDHRTTTLAEAVTDRSLDIVVDCVGGREQWLQARRVLRPGGRFVTISRDEDGVVTVPSMLTMVATILGRRLGSLRGDRIAYLPVFLHASHTLLDRVDDLVRSGRLEVHVGVRRALDLDNLLELVERGRRGRTVGKMVLEVVPGDVAAPT